LIDFHSRPIRFEITLHTDNGFLVYAQNLDYEIDSLGSTYYRRVIFRVQDFLKYKKESDNYYQVKFFDELQTNSLIKFFSDTQYRSLVTIPEVKLDKGKQNSWIAKVWIAEELYFYKFPFSFPDSFLSYQTDHQLQVKLQIIQAISTHSLEKKFCGNHFLSQFNVSKQKQAYIKKLIVQEFNYLQEESFIKNQFQLITKSGIIQKVDKLIPLRIGQSKLIIFYEDL
jgi:hypothetical protein